MSMSGSGRSCRGCITDRFSFTRRAGVAAILCGLVLTGVCATGWAADRETESLIREVTAGAKTDAERAEKLIAAARLAEGNQLLRMALLERAVEHGMKAALTPKLVGTLDGALQQLIAKDAGRAEQWRQRRMTLYRTWYRRAGRKDKVAAGGQWISRLLSAAKQHEQADRWDKAAATYTEAGSIATTIRHPDKDAITQAGVRARHFAGVRRKVAGYERILASKPDNTPARKALLVALTVDLDDPAAAEKHLTDAVGEVWNTYLPMAAGAADKLDANGCKELGTWYYRELTRKAGDRGKVNVLYRVKVYYERFLALHGKKDVAALKAQVALKDIDAELARLAGRNIRPLARMTVPTGPPPPIVPPPPTGEWIDALKLVDVTKHCVTGEAKRLDSGAIHLLPGKGEGNPRVMIPVPPPGSYEFSARFVRESGNDKVGFILPTGRTAVRLTFSDSKGTAHGLSRINKKLTKDNEAAVRPGTLVNGKEYAVTATVRVKGNQVSIEAALDDKTLIRWQGPQSALDLYPTDRLPDPRCMGLVAWLPTVFRSVKIRTVTPPGSGKTVVVKVLPKNWQRFGQVKKGQTLSLTAEGTWQDGSTIRPTTGPEGTRGPGKKPILYLEARVAGKTHKVGKGKTILVEKDGGLEMRMMRAVESIYKTSGPKATGFMTVTIREE